MGMLGYPRSDENGGSCWFFSSLTLIQARALEAYNASLAEATKGSTGADFVVESAKQKAGALAAFRNAAADATPEVGRDTNVTLM
eukprot:1182579-Prorocentrum_minimum.AAC.2